MGLEHFGGGFTDTAAAAGDESGEALQISECHGVELPLNYGLLKMGLEPVVNACGAFERRTLQVWVAPRCEAGEDFAAAEFDKVGDVVGGEVFHTFAPADAAGGLGDEVLDNLGAGLGGLCGGVHDAGELEVLRWGLGQLGLHRLGGVGHERRVEGAADVEWEDAFGAQGFGGLGGGFEVLAGAGEDDLARGVIVCHGDAALGGGLFGVFDGEAEDGEHPPPFGLGHGLAAGFDQLHGLGEGEGAGGGDGGIFAEAVAGSCGNFVFYFRVLTVEIFPRQQAGEQEGGLGVLREGEGFNRAIVHELAEGGLEDVFGLFEHLLGPGQVEEGLGHAYALAALAGEEKGDRVFHAGSACTDGRNMQERGRNCARLCLFPCSLRRGRA